MPEIENHKKQCPNVICFKIRIEFTSSPSRSRVNKRNVFKHKFIEFESNERIRVNNSATSRCFLSKSRSGNEKLFAF